MSTAITLPAHVASWVQTGAANPAMAEMMQGMSPFSQSRQPRLAV